MTLISGSSLTSVSGFEFGACYADKDTILIGELTVPVISLARLREKNGPVGEPKIWRSGVFV